LIRHALPARVEVLDGPADPGLAPEGAAQASQLAAGLADDRLAAVVSSPMRRARETADPLASASGLAVETRDDLAEFDRASSWYVPMEELRAERDPRWRAIIEGRWDEVYGVDLQTFQGAAVDAVESVIADHPGGRVAVVTHGGVINAYVARVVESRKAGIFEPGYTSVTRVLAARSGERTLRSLNDTSHLRPRAGEPATTGERITER